MYLEIFLADFAVFRVFWEFRGFSRKYLNFAGPRLREISEALIQGTLVLVPRMSPEKRLHCKVETIPHALDKKTHL